MGRRFAPLLTLTRWCSPGPAEISPPDTSCACSVADKIQICSRDENRMGELRSASRMPEFVALSLGWGK
jgi:hypothetical protein